MNFTLSLKKVTLQRAASLRIAGHQVDTLPEIWHNSQFLAHGLRKNIP